MPKAPSTKRRGEQREARRPLAQDVQEDRLVSRFGRVRAPRERATKEDDADADGGAEGARPMRVTGSRAGKSFVDPRLGRKILKLAREQQDEIEQEELPKKATTKRMVSDGHYRC